MVRLLTCGESGWFDANITEVSLQVLRMCASARACAELCAGVFNETDSIDRQFNYRALLSKVDSLGPDERRQLVSPSVVQELLLPIVQVATRLAQSISEDTASPAVAMRIDALTNPGTGACKAYDPVLSAFVAASGSPLSPFAELAPSASLPGVRAARSPAFAACKTAIAGLTEVCLTREAAGLCARSSDPNVAVIGSFGSCGDSGLSSYFEAVAAYNAQCATIGFPQKPTNAPARSYYLYADGQLSMADCLRDTDSHPQIVDFFAVFTVLWATIAVSLVYCRLAGLQWLCACDVTMDVSRSRAFTVSGTLWLLYFFYRYTYQYLRNIKLNACSKGWPECGGFYFPFVLYLFVICFMWVAAFGWIFVVNNPHRQHSDLISLLGVLTCHYYTFTLARQSLRDLDLYGDDFASRCQKFFEICLICVLQAALDLCFLRVWFGKLLGWKGFHDDRGDKYIEYITSALNKPSAARGGSLRLLATCTAAAGEPTPRIEDLEPELARWAGREDCLVLVSVGPVAPAHDGHRQRASDLGLCPQFDQVCSLEMVLVRNGAERDSVLRAEQQEAAKQGREAEVARLQAVRAQIRASKTRVSRRDAVLLSSILSSDLFAQVLGNRHAERHFGSAMAALHHFCIGLGHSRANRARPETRERLLSVLKTSEADLNPKHLELACGAPDSDLQSLILALSGSDPEDTLREFALKAHDAGRVELVSRLSAEAFLCWLDAGTNLDSEIARRHARNPYPLESSALDSFFLSQCDGDENRHQFKTRDIVSKMIAGVRNPQVARAFRFRRRGLLQSVLGLSRGRDPAAWHVWADAEQQQEDNPNFGGSLAFTPSILHICVGISAAIILSNYVYELAFAVRTRDLLLSVISRLRFVAFVFKNIALASFDVAGCVDPVLLERVKDISAEDYLLSLQSWPPLAAQIDSAMQNLTAAMNQSSVANAVGDTQSEQTKSQAISAFFLAVIRGLVSPEVLSTLPVFGPSVGCFYREATSPQIEAIIDDTVSAVVAETSKSQVQVDTVSPDPCRSLLRSQCHATVQPRSVLTET